MAIRWKVLKKRGNEWVSLYAKGSFQLTYNEGEVTTAPGISLLYTFRTKKEATSFMHKVRCARFLPIDDTPALARLQTKGRGVITQHAPSVFSEQRIKDFWTRFQDYRKHDPRPWTLKEYLRTHEEKCSYTTILYPEVEVLKITPLGEPTS